MESITSDTVPNSETPRVEPVVLPPIALIEVLDTHNRVYSIHRLTTVGESCKVGRSLTCEIVLDDPYAAPEHTTLTLLADGRISVFDLGGKNGTRVEGERIATSTPMTIAKGELIIGRTRVRVRTALTSLTPERVFRRDALQRHRTVLALVGLSLCAACVAFVQWIAFPDPLAGRVLTVVIFTLGAIGIWTGIWGLITRFGHGAWELRTHIAIGANALAICLWSNWLLGIAQFALQWDWMEFLGATIVAGAALGALFLHLRKATHLSVRNAGITAFSLPFVLIGAAIWVAQQNTRDINRLAPSPNIYPPELRVAASIELSDYLATAQALKREANRKRRISLADRPLAESE